MAWDPGTEQDGKEKPVESRYNIDSDNKKKKLWNGQKKKIKGEKAKI